MRYIATEGVGLSSAGWLYPQATASGMRRLVGRSAMNLDTDKIDDAALALLYLTLHDGYRAWKGMDWDVLGRLHEKGMIADPVGKVKSVVFTQEGLDRAKAMCEALFGKK
jgi:hypothetical protein